VVLSYRLRGNCLLKGNSLSVNFSSCCWANGTPKAASRHKQKSGPPKAVVVEFISDSVTRSVLARCGQGKICRAFEIASRRTFSPCTLRRSARPPLGSCRTWCNSRLCRERGMRLGDLRTLFPEIPCWRQSCVKYFYERRHLDEGGTTI